MYRGEITIYRTEVLTKTISVKDFMENYYEPVKFLEACKMCPSYGKVWSCPPRKIATTDLVKDYSKVILSIVKVVYSEEDRAYSRTLTPEELEHYKTDTYGTVKKLFNETLLAVEMLIPGARIVAAGECRHCNVCARVDGKPCRFPEKMRYSFSSLGINITEMVKRELDVDLLWSAGEVPEYVAAIGAVFIK